VSALLEGIIAVLNVLAETAAT